MTINIDNYHKPESNADYMSVSQYKGWLSCEAKQLAVMSGVWLDADKPAFALGRLVDQALLTPGRLAADMAENPATYNTKTGHRAWVTDGLAMVDRCKRDAMFMGAITGEPQVVITFDLFGVPWKSMIDVYDHKRGLLTDLKTCANIDAEEWSDAHGQRVPFYEAYNYWLQFAVYREAVRSKYGDYPKLCLIAAVSKQDPPDIRLIEFNVPYRFKKELAGIEAKLPRIMAIKRGETPPNRCDDCDYCRSTRVLTGVEQARSIATETLTESEFVNG